MKKKILCVGILLLLSPFASAALLGTGKITKFNVTGGGTFAIYMSVSSGPYSSGWYYASKSSMDVDGWRALQSLALVVYSQDKTANIYADTINCNSGSGTFNGMDTLD